MTISRTGFATLTAEVDVRRFSENRFDFSLEPLAECAAREPVVVLHDVGSHERVRRLASVELDAESDAPTLCNLTNHSYFNLDGGRDIFDRIIWGSRITLYIVGLVTVIVVPIGLVIGIVDDVVRRSSRKRRAAQQCQRRGLQRQTVLQFQFVQQSQLPALRRVYIHNHRAFSKK